jgi:hypothetical protein
LWLDLTTTKWRSDWRNLFYNGNIIPAFMSPSGNLILHVVMQRKLLTSVIIFIEATMERPNPPFFFSCLSLY